MASKQFTIPTIFKAVDNMTGVIAGIHKSMQNFTARTTVGLARAERGFRSLMAPISAVNRLLGGLGIYVGVYGLYRTIKGMIDVFSEFQQANANLAAIMGTTVNQNKALSDQAKILGLTTAKTATEVVGLQIELAKLGFQQDQIINMTPAIISGSIALDAALDRTSLLVGSITKNFDNFSKTGSDSQHIMDVMALAANDTSLDFSKMEVALRQAAPAANAVGLSFEQTLAILGALSNSNIDASQSGTGLRNILLDSARKGHTYQQVLGNILKKQNLLVASADKFGRRTAISAVVLAKNLQFVSAESERLTNVTKGYADVIATKRLDTYIGSLTLLKAAYQGLILSIEDGTGRYSKVLTNLNKIARAILLIATDTPEARHQLLYMNNEIVKQAQTWISWLKAIGYVAAGLVALRGLIMGWGVVLGVYRALVALQIAWNAGIFAAAGTIMTVMLPALAALTLAASAVAWSFDTIGNNWEETVAAFKSGDILSGIAKFLNMIYDIILYPLQKLTEKIGELTGMQPGGLFKNIRKWLGINVDYDPNKGTADQQRIQRMQSQWMGNMYSMQTGFNPAMVPNEYKQLFVPPQASREDYVRKVMETTQRQNVTIGFQNAPQGMKVESDNDLVKINNGGTTMPPWYK